MKILIIEMFAFVISALWCLITGLLLTLPLVIMIEIVYLFKKNLQLINDSGIHIDPCEWGGDEGAESAEELNPIRKFLTS